MPAVRITPEDAGTFLFQPFGMGRVSFQSYLSATQGAAYVKLLNASRATLDVSIGIVAKLHSMGFSFFTDDATRDKFQGVLESRRDAVSKLDERLKALDGILHDYQIEGARYMASRHRALLADEMGLGKTVQTLSALPDNHRVLVECPAVVKSVWENECYRWRDGYFPTILDGRGNFRWPNVNEILIVNHDILPDVFPTPPKDGRLVIVFDEMHRHRSERTKAYKKLKAIRDKVLPIDAMMWGLTATPMLNKQPELWAILDLLDLAREAFGSKSKFAKMCGGRFIKNLQKSEWGDPSEAAKHALGQVMLRRVKSEVGINLPAKSYAYIPVDLSLELAGECSEAWAQLESVWNDSRESWDGVETAKKAGIGFQEYSRLRQALSTAKTSAAIDWVENMEAADEPCVVFSAHISPLEELAKRPGWAIITGSVPAKKRQEIVERFQNGELKGIAASIQAAGVGITLTRACNALFISQEWTPAINWQAEARIDRIGQERPVTIYVLVGNHPLEKRVAEVNRDKSIKIHAMVVTTSKVETAPTFPSTATTEVPKIITVRLVTRECKSEMERLWITVLETKQGVMNPGDKRAVIGIIRALPSLTETQWKLVKALGMKYERR